MAHFPASLSMSRLAGSSGTQKVCEASKSRNSDIQVRTLGLSQIPAAMTQRGLKHQSERRQLKVSGGVPAFFMTGRSGISVSLYQEASRRQTASCCGSGTSLSEKTSRRPCSRQLRLRQYSMCLSGDVLVFIIDCEPICALQARVEILQAAAIESCARDGHFRFISQVASTSSLYEVSQHRASSGPLRLLRWSRGDRAGLKADV